MKINGIVVKGDKVAFDGCHKIYIIDGRKQEKEANKAGYNVYGIIYLPDIWRDSCPYRFISSWDLQTTYVQQGVDKYSVKFE